MDCGYKPYFDPDFESLIERIYPPRVVVDNETCQNSTLVKVDSKNKHGILLEMVQVLTDLDLLISKSYISSDGGWFMDVFHVTDQLGNKVTDDTLIHYIQQALCARKGSSKSKSRGGGGGGGGGNGAKEVVVQQQKKWLPGSVVGSSQISSTEYTAFEMTANDRPGLLSEVSAVLAQLGCHVAAVAAWTHNTRAACIFYVDDEKKCCFSNKNNRGGGGGGKSDESTTAAGAGGAIIRDESRLAEVEEQLENVVGAHHGNGERRMVRLASPAAARTHMERRLHQLMYADGDYEEVEVCNSGGSGRGGYTSTINSEPEVSIENCNERGYSVVSVRCTDRPKLLFDTVCTLTDMEYVVFHAAISSKGSLAVQEYYIRHVDGCTMDTESERRRVIQCLVAAIDRRVSHGLKLDLCTRNRVGLLSDVTRVFREHGLSVLRAEIGTRGEKAVGSFIVTDASGNDADPKTVELLRKEIGVTALEINRSSPGRPYRSSSNSSSNNSSSNNINTFSVDIEERNTRTSSLGSLLWAQLGRFSSNFGPIKS